MTFQNELRGWIEENGLTRKQVANILGVSNASITYWLAKPGRNPIKEKRYLQIMKSTINVNEVNNVSTPPVSSQQNWLERFEWLSQYKHWQMF